jgi:hypothetical protein
MSDLKLNTTMTSLKLDQVVCACGEVSKPLADMLAVNSTLQTLNACGPLFDDEGAKERAHMLTVNSTLLELDLGHQWSGSSGSQTSPACRVKSNSSLRTLIVADGDVANASLS